MGDIKKRIQEGEHIPTGTEIEESVERYETKARLMEYKLAEEFAKKYGKEYFSTTAVRSIGTFIEKVSKSTIFYGDYVNVKIGRFNVELPIKSNLPPQFIVSPLEITRKHLISGRIEQPRMMFKPLNLIKLPTSTISDLLNMEVTDVVREEFKKLLLITLNTVLDPNYISKEQRALISKD